MRDFDVIVVGAGVSGSFLALELCKKGKSVLVLEAGRQYDRTNYPRKELDGSSQLYWSGGMELNSAADIVFLRPKCVGGGSVVNQALVDRFDDVALDSWRAQTKIDFFSQDKLEPYYTRAEAELSIQTIPESAQNRNAKIFKEGFEKNGHVCAPLSRAQSDCSYERNDCIECLNGCRVDSKQSMPVTTLKKVLASGKVKLLAEAEVQLISDDRQGVSVQVRGSAGNIVQYRASKLVLAGGAIGNTRLLALSNLAQNLPKLGLNFYTHPQYMNFGYYDDPVHAEKGAFQSLKSADPHFRKKGFKLENVFAGPVGIALLMRAMGTKHMDIMRRLSHLACIEVAVRDTEPGQIKVSKNAKVSIVKNLNEEDRARKARGLNTVNEIFRSTGAKEIFESAWGIGLHLMGGCSLAQSAKEGVVNPEFKVFSSHNVFAADSSVFPNAPGINPSLTIIALSIAASEHID